MEFWEAAINVAANNALLLVLLGMAAWRLYPKLFKLTLMNGGGDAIRGIIELANSKQTVQNDEKIASAFREHEKYEESKIQAALMTAIADSRKQTIEVEGRMTQAHNGLEERISAESGRLERKIDRVADDVGDLRGRVRKLEVKENA